MSTIPESGIEKLIARLQHVRARPGGEYVADCPAHADRQRSLLIRMEGGRWTVRCFHGCPAVTVIEATGLRLAHLIDDLTGHGLRNRPQVDAADLVCIIAREVHAVVATAERLVRGQPISKSEQQALVQATGRINLAIGQALFGPK